ncbi:MAG: glycosyltransferase family 2 protein [Candidatus Gracilibacteria bacterium]|nr:glycosyltransferase family 2 protein [Candidatus Gracilibacteria bacterium]
MPKILVAIPCYRCEKQIKRVIEKFDQKLLGRITHVMVLDNQSPDNTIQAAKEALKQLGTEKLTVYRNDQNNNLGGSHKIAFNYAIENGFDYVAILHGDDQGETQELNILIDTIEKDPELDAALGARFMFRSKLKGYSQIRIWGNLVLNTIFTILSFRLTKDLGSGINIFKMSELKDKNYLGFTNYLTFNIDLLLDYYRKGSKIKFIPITWSETDQLSNAKASQVAWTAFKTLLRWRFGQAKRLGPQEYLTTKVS